MTERDVQEWAYVQFSSAYSRGAVPLRELDGLVSRWQLSHILRRLALSHHRDQDYVRSLAFKDDEFGVTLDSDTYVLKEKFYHPVTMEQFLFYVNRWKGSTTTLGREVAALVWDAIATDCKKLRLKFRTADVMAIVARMRLTEDFTAMPILADALDEAGFSNESCLRHYRDLDAMFSFGSWIFRATNTMGAPK